MVGHHGGVVYRERATRTPGGLIWTQGTSAALRRSLILPDGCMDLIWDGRAIFVAGPDATARWHEAAPGTAYVGLRLTHGLGARALGVRADQLVGERVDIADLWPDRIANPLLDQVCVDPVAAFDRWLSDRTREVEVDRSAARIFQLARRGNGPAEIARALGVPAKRLHRQCVTTFGYGPKRLGRILRLERAVATARADVGFSRVAAECGYSDQPHLSREVRDLTGLTLTELVPGPAS